MWRELLGEDTEESAGWSKTRRTAHTITAAVGASEMASVASRGEGRPELDGEGRSRGREVSHRGRYCLRCCAWRQAGRALELKVQVRA